MKKLIKIFSLCLVLFGSASAATVPGDGDNEKTKSYSKTYAVGSGDKISLDNSFGEMKISTWSKNEIKVDVMITVRSSTDDRSQKILDRIKIEDGKNGSNIFFKTNVNDIKEDNDDTFRSDNNKEHNNRFTINYVVYLPANATLDATNQFGAMSIGDFDGALTLSSKFGSLTAGKLSQPKKVSIQFGNTLSVIESMNNGKLSIQFSRAQVNKLSGDVTADLEQSHGVKLNLDNSLKQLDVRNSFSEVYLDADKNLSASFTIKTSMGDFSNQSSFAVGAQESEHGYYSYTANRTYTGKSGSGTIPVSVKSSFGKVTLGHNLTMDANDKNSKHEKKVKV